MLISTEPFALAIVKDKARVDSRLLAVNMHNQHHNTMGLILKHQTAMELFGKILFKTEPLPDSKTGQKERFALLNEDQAFYLVALSRNSPRVVELKGKLVKAFGEARRAASQHEAEYLPTYLQLHDEIHALAAGSSHKRQVHMNVNRLINKTVGLEAGQRSAASLPQQSLLAVAQAVAVRAARGASDHRTGYQQIKAAMFALSAATLGLGAV